MHIDTTCSHGLLGSAAGSGFSAQPGSGSGPLAPRDEVTLCKEGESALQSLLAQGAQLTKRRAIRMPGLKAEVPVSAEECVKNLKEHPGKYQLTVGSSEPVSLRGLDDLAALSVIYGAAPPTLASHPGLVEALRCLSSQVEFVATKVEPTGLDSYSQDVGPLGAWQALSGAAVYEDLRLRSSARDAAWTNKPDGVVGYAFFYGGGSSKALEHEDLAVSLDTLEEKGVTFAAREPQDAFETYRALTATDTDASVLLRWKRHDVVEAKRSALEAPDFLTRFDQAAQQCESDMTARAQEALVARAQEALPLPTNPPPEAPQIKVGEEEVQIGGLRIPRRKTE